MYFYPEESIVNDKSERACWFWSLSDYIDRKLLFWSNSIA